MICVQMGQVECVLSGGLHTEFTQQMSSVQTPFGQIVSDGWLSKTPQLVKALHVTGGG